MHNDFVKSLISDSGHPRHHGKLMPYQRFIGSWRFDWVGHNEDGSTRTVPGEWHFSWILEGRAIQDNWICPQTDLRSSEDYPEGEYGTTIRFYDFKENCIRIVFVGPILSNLRIFEDNLGKMNLSIKQVNQEILSVPQFTLYADTRRGRRPGFDLSAAPDMAKDYWERFNCLLAEDGIGIKKGIFGVHMDVELVNDGPVTIWLDSES